jgi:hypothetical protein
MPPHGPFSVSFFMYLSGTKPPHYLCMPLHELSTLSSLLVAEMYSKNPERNCGLHAASTLILLPGKGKIREYVNSENAPIGFVNKVSRYSELVLFTSTEHYFSKLSESVTYTRLLCPSCHLNLNLNLNLNQQIWNPVALRLRPIPASFNCILSE